MDHLTQNEPVDTQFKDDFFRAVVENAPDLILFLDSFGRIQYVNPALSSLLGYRQADWVGVSLVRFVDAVLSPAFIYALEHKTPSAQVRAVMRARDHSWLTLDCQVQAMRLSPTQTGCLIIGRSPVKIVQPQSEPHTEQNTFRQYLDLVGSIILVTNPANQVTWVNAFACSFLEYPLEDILGVNFFETFISASDRPAATAVSDSLLHSQDDLAITEENVVVTRSGQERTVIWRHHVIRDRRGAASSIIRVGEDVTELRRSQDALKASEQRYSLAIQGANDGVWDWDFTSSSFYTSPRWKEILGYEAHELANTAEVLKQLVHPDDEEKLRLALDAHIQGSSPQLEIEFRMLHKEGQVVWVLLRGLALRNAAGVPDRMAGSLTDITARKINEQRLAYDALHDVLTGLPNRMLLYDRLERAIQRYKRHPGYPYAVLFLDLDHFKNVNDSLGHQVGDQLLVAFGQMILTGMRSVDTIARLGGDEFVILLEELLSTEDAVLVAERIKEITQQSILLEGKEHLVSASTGIVVASAEYTTPQELLRDADIAMYTAKARNRGSYVLFQTEMRQKAVNRLELEADLHDALRLGNLELHYQPIINLSTNAIASFEALMRWRNPRRGLMYPGEFLPIAEEAGLLVDLEKWVLGEACRQIHRWRIQFPFTPPLAISVNLSTRHFQQPDMADQIAVILQSTGLAPQALQLETIESTLTQNAGPVPQNLDKLRQLGIKIYIDNFGTGYSSLSYLQTLALDSIKIDRSFVSQIGTGRTELVQSMLRVADELNVQAIAEGVETSVQYERLRSMGCQYAQGFFLGHPLTRIEIEEMLAKVYKQYKNKE